MAAHEVIGCEQKQRRHLAQGVAAVPARVVAGERLADVPTGLHEHRLEWVHRDAVVRAVPAGVHVVVAGPVLVVPPVQPLRRNVQRVFGNGQDSARRRAARVWHEWSPSASKPEGRLASRAL